MTKPAPDKPGMPAEPVSKARLRLWLRLLKATRRIEAELRENLRREFATTLPRFDVMAALSRHEGGLKMSALSGELKVSNGNVTGIVDWLAGNGMVVRVPVPGDKRVSMVRLTEKGREAFARQAAAHELWVSRLLEGFDADEAAELGACLERAVVRMGDENER